MATIAPAPKPVEGLTIGTTFSKAKGVFAKWRDGKRRVGTWDDTYLTLAKAFGGDELTETLNGATTQAAKLTALFEAAQPTLARNLLRWVVADDTTEAHRTAWMGEKANLMTEAQITAAVAMLPTDLQAGAAPVSEGPKKTWTNKYIAYALLHQEAVTKFLADEHAPADDRVAPPLPPGDPPGGPPNPPGDGMPEPVEGADLAVIKAIDEADEAEGNSETPTKALLGRYARIAKPEDLKATVSAVYKSIVRATASKEDMLDMLDQSNVRYMVAHIAEALKEAADVTEDLVTPKKGDGNLDVSITQVVRKNLLPVLRGGTNAGTDGTEGAKGLSEVFMQDKAADKVATATSKAAGSECGEGALDPACIEELCALKGGDVMNALIEFDKKGRFMDPTQQAIRRSFLISGQPVPDYINADSDCEMDDRADLPTELATITIPACLKRLALSPSTKPALLSTFLGNRWAGCYADRMGTSCCPRCRQPSQPRRLRLRRIRQPCH